MNHENHVVSSSEESIDPQRVPARVLWNGAKIPALGLGTFGSDRYSAEDVAQAVKEAIGLGYRHIDCASVYGNEHFIGQSLREAMHTGTRREELWVTSKLWNDRHGEQEVIASCEQSLRDLGLDYLDLYLVHWPFPNFHAPKVDVSSRDPHARPYVHENYMKTWRQMEKLVEMGLVRQIGTSNMSIAKLKLLLRDVRIKPAINEMELHPHFQQPELFAFVRENGIVPVGYSPLGSPSRPERDRTPEDSVDMEDPVILEIAARRAIHPAQVCIQWGLQRGQVVIPFAVRRSQLVSNLRAAVNEPFTEEEMSAIAGIDRNCRLIKGQVFLWEGAQGWEDLWDLDGVIAG